MDWRAPELRRDVHRNLLGIAGVAATTLGFAGRCDRVAEIRDRQLLD